MPTGKELRAVITPVRTQWADRRRPSLNKTDNVVLKYEEVADLKKEVLNLEIQLLLQQQEQAQQKFKWEQQQQEIKEKVQAEEFQFKKTVLELDIEIKKLYHVL